MGMKGLPHHSLSLAPFSLSPSIIGGGGRERTKGGVSFNELFQGEESISEAKKMSFEAHFFIAQWK